MKNEFKAGDLVFEVSTSRGIRLTKVSSCGKGFYPIRGSLGDYTTDGCKFGSDDGIPSLLHTTPENRQALVTLYGEDTVPKLPVRGSELTKKLLEKQKYVLCWISSWNDDAARVKKTLTVIECMNDSESWFVCVDGHGYNYAVPIDNNGNEITEIEE